MLDKFLVILAVAAFIQRADGRILIVKKSKEEKVDGGLWTVPGGKVDPDEHIIAALKRETKEECNLDIESYGWLNEDVFESGGKYFHGHHFICSVSNPEDVKLEKKLLEFQWVNGEELGAYEFHPNIRKELEYILSDDSCCGDEGECAHGEQECCGGVGGEGCHCGK